MPANGRPPQSPLRAGQLSAQHVQFDMAPPGFAQNRAQDRVESMRHQRGFMTPESHQPLHCTYAQSSSHEWYARPTDRVPGCFAAG